MHMAAKIFLTFMILMVGGILYGMIRDTIGRGHYAFRAVEILVLIYIWTRPTKR
jgi:hypothetical protein